MPRILICSYLEPQLVERICSFDGDVTVDFRPDLIPKPRYAADHVGTPLQRSDAESREWHGLMSQAEILFDFDYADIEGMCFHGTQVRWIQASSAGVGRFVRNHRIDRMSAVVTTASGVHARPLAEFSLWAMLGFVKGYPLAHKQQRDRTWARYCGDELDGKTVAVVGLGSVGREVAALAKLLGMRVLATKRITDGVDALDQGVDALYPTNRLPAMVADADFVVLSAPGTPATENMIDQRALAAMKQGAVLVNIGRGTLVDEDALIEALRSGRLAGAVLDVARTEPLPASHPFWDMDNVIVFPHSASTSHRENERLTQLFLDNLGRYLAGGPLRNAFDADRMY